MSYTNPFKTAANKATTGSLKRRMLAEGDMALALLRALLERGYVISINDGEDMVGENLDDSLHALSLMYSTDEDHVYAMKDGERVAWFYMVYGNSGYDVLSDYSANSLGDDIWDNVMSPLSDELEKDLT